jgi:hypothetical protein
MQTDNFSHYHCTAEWHFSRFTGHGATLAPIIYDFAFHLTKPPQKPYFYASTPNLAEYFGVDEKTVRKALRLLAKSGFFELVRAMPGRTNQYRPVRHPEWQKKYPERCIQRLQVTYGDEDPLGPVLYAASGSNFKVLGANVLKSMRNTGHSDDAIATHFNNFLETEGPFTREEYRNGFLRMFMVYLRAQPMQLETAKAANAL